MTSKTYFLAVFACGILPMTGVAFGQPTSTDDENSPNETANTATEPAQTETADAESVQASPIRVIADPESARGEDDDELICRRTQVTGTHRRVRRCFTRAELDAQREDAQEFLRDRVRTSTGDDDSL